MPSQATHWDSGVMLEMLQAGTLHEVGLDILGRCVARRERGGKILMVWATKLSVEVKNAYSRSNNRTARAGCFAHVVNLFKQQLYKCTVQRSECVTPR